MRKLDGKRLFNLFLSLILALSLSAFIIACGTTGETSEKESAATSEESVGTSESEKESQSESVIPKECTITFETYDGSIVDPITVLSGEYAEKPDNPTKTGHVFKGWYLDLENTEDGSFMFDETPIVEDITLHALWQIRQYTVSYQDADGNAIAGLADQIVDWGSLIAVPDESTVAKDGYLVKWYTAQGDIWDFETSKVMSNTTLICRYVTTKDTYNAKDIADNFYPTYDKTNVGAEFANEHYVEGAETVNYTYDAGKANNKGGLQQIVLNVELSTLDYASVTIVFRATSFAVNEETGEYTFDATTGGSFSQYRAYVLTDQGGDVSFNDEPSSGYNPVNYYIQSTATNKELFSIESLEDGWSAVTFDLASLKFWNEGEKLYAFAFGYVCSTWAVEFKSVVFNKVDKTQEYTVQFVDRLGNELAETQTLAWNGVAQKPETLANADGRVYTGEWLDASGEVYDFSKRVRSNVVLTPEYTIEGKYSWTGTDVAKDLFAVYNENPTLPAVEMAGNNSSIYIYNAGNGNALKQVVVDNLNLAKGNVKYFTFTWRVIDNATKEYNPSGIFNLVRVYLQTDVGGHPYDKDLEDAGKFYINFNSFSASEVTTPVDMTAKLEDGWFTVTVDLTGLEYFATATTIKGIGFGTTNGATNGIEIKEVAFLEELPSSNVSHTVTYLDENGEAIEGLDVQTVPYGKAAGMPSVDLVPKKEFHAFNGWVDAEGNAFTFGTLLTEDIVLYASYVESWEGETYTLAGQDIVDSMTAAHERYGNTASAQKEMSLDADGNAYFDFAPLNKPNMTVTMLNAGVRVHEGSKLVVKYKSSNFGTFSPNRLNLCIAFRGQDPATQINSANTTSYYQYKDIAYGTTEGTGANNTVSFVVGEDGIVTVTFDLYAMQQAYIALGVAEEGVDLNYIDAFTFMVVETDSGTGAKTSKATLTYLSFEFQDVLIAPVEETPDVEETPAE